MAAAEHLDERSTHDRAMRWLMGVRPDPGRPLPPPASTPATVAHAVELLGRNPVDWAVQVGHGMATHIIEEIPELGGGEAPFQSLRMGTESATIRALVRITRSAADLPAITEEALQGDREFVRRGVALDRVLRGVRLGHAGMARAFMAACDVLLPEEQRSEAMRVVSEQLFDYIDEFSGSMASEYINERDRWVTSAAAAREEVVRGLLDGTMSDPGPASAALSYDLSRQHVALLLWFQPARVRADTAELQRVAVDVLRHWGCSQHLIVPIGRGRLWAWGSRLELPRRLSIGSYVPERADVRLAHGLPVGGIEGFRRSHREAEGAERLTRSRAGSRGWATSYGDVELPALLTADLPAARAFVQRELGALAKPGGPAADLRDTLLAYLEEQNSSHAAAQRLHVSRNTVSYRVKRAEELLGSEWRQRRHELQTALLLVRELGEAVLVEPGAG
jgi:DNA-binding PucR family transcriptional regulator